MGKAYRCKSLDCLQTARYHTLGNLPEPVLTHRFCGSGVQTIHLQISPFLLNCQAKEIY